MRLRDSISQQQQWTEWRPYPCRDKPFVIIISHTKQKKKNKNNRNKTVHTAHLEDTLHFLVILRLGVGLSLGNAQSQFQFMKKKQTLTKTNKI